MKLNIVRLGFITGAVVQLLALLKAVREFDTFILRLVADDAFYYLKIAQNIGAGHGSVFSLGETTNGYHPLWMAAVTALSLLPLSENGLVLAVLTLSVALNLIWVRIFVSQARLLALSDSQTALAVVLFLASPWMTNLTLTGLETSLLFVVLLLYLASLNALLQSPASVGLRQSIVFGIYSGLLFLARTDMIFILLWSAGYIVCRMDRPRAVRLVTMGFSAVAVVSPWLIWNLSTFHTILQSSGYAISIERWHRMSPLPWSAYAAQVWLYLVATVDWLLFAPIIPHPTYDIYLFAESESILFVLAVFIISTLRSFPGGLRSAWGAAYLGSLTLMGIDIFVRLVPRTWHAAPLLLVFLALAARSLPRFGRVTVSLVMGSLAWMTVGSWSLAYFYPQEVAWRSIQHITEIESKSAAPLTLCIADAGYPAFLPGIESSISMGWSIIEPLRPLARENFQRILRRLTAIKYQSPPLGEHTPIVI